MKVIVVFESMFGNTKVLAQNVRDGLADAGANVELVGVIEAAAGEFADCDLIVIAAPTHALSLSRPQTRADAVKKGADPACAPTGIREWLDILGQTLPATSVHSPVAVLDTRVRKARHWSGSAAKRAARTLRKGGFTVMEQMSFYVVGVTGPVTPGEHERARMWGRHLAEMVPSHPGSQGSGRTGWRPWCQWVSGAPGSGVPGRSARAWRQTPRAAGAEEEQEDEDAGAEQVVVEDRVVLRGQDDGPHEHVHQYAGADREPHADAEDEREPDPEQAGHEQGVGPDGAADGVVEALERAVGAELQEAFGGAAAVDPGCVTEAVQRAGLVVARVEAKGEQLVREGPQERQPEADPQHGSYASHQVGGCGS